MLGLQRLQKCGTVGQIVARPKVPHLQAFGQNWKCDPEIPSDSIVGAGPLPRNWARRRRAVAPSPSIPSEEKWACEKTKTRMNLLGSGLS